MLKLKLFMQQTVCMPLFFAFGYPRATDGELLIADQRRYFHRIGRIMDELRERYGEVELSVVNSWGMFALWDVLKLGITPRLPTWVLNGKKICEGVPDPKRLFEAIDSELSGALRQPGT
ncbi:MAG: hypothetical protein LBR87_09285 [Synergistaceae bacterium]|jgi:hypothetical protein|nr:hypothetical protein [Synergistaceae bacterium]